MSQQIDVYVLLEIHLRLHINEDAKYILHLGREMTFNHLPSKGSLIQIGILSTDAYKSETFEVDYLISGMNSYYREFRSSLKTVPRLTGFREFLGRFSLSKDRDQILDDFKNIVEEDGWSIEVEFT